MKPKNRNRGDTAQAITVDQFTRQALPFARMPAHADSIARLVELSNCKSTSRVLDVACGPGLVARAFAAKAKQVVGVDLTQAMVDLAKSESPPEVEFQLADAAKLPFDEKRIDIVVTRYSMHHFETPSECLAEMGRVCKPGGRLVVADMQPTASSANAFNALERLRDPSHRKAFTLDEMVAMIESQGFRMQRIENYGVTVDLDQQLEASFPAEGDAERFRERLIDDIDQNQFGLAVERQAHRYRYTYPIGIYVAIRNA